MPTETFAITESVFCQLSVLFCTLRHQTPKCADFCAKAEAFVKNALAQLRGDERIPYPSHAQLWPQNAEAAVIRNEQNLGLRSPEVAKTVQRESKPEIEAEREAPVQSKHRSRDLDF